MTAIGLEIKPFIIIVGASVTEINSIFIRINNYSYELKSFLSALEVLFKFYITYNILYPLECQSVCFFIQWFLLKIRQAGDIKIPAVCTMINKLKNSK